MPRCGKCHSQWATLFRCPHCEVRFPCPLQLLLVSLAIPAAIVATIYVLSSFTHKVEDWRAVKNTDPVVEKSLRVRVDKSGLE